MTPTPYSDLNQVLAALVDSAQSVFGAKLLDIYLQGSFAVGDFDEHSDVDFIAVLEGELTQTEIDGLNVMHRTLYDLPSEWAKHLEGSYFPIRVLAMPPGDEVWYLDHGHTTLERSMHCNTYVVRWTVERFGISLIDPQTNLRGWGPLAAEIPSVATEDLRTEMKTTLIEWGKEILANPKPYENRFYQGFIVLNYCRMLRDIETGSLGSKRTGADWAKANLPRQWHDLIDRAWLCRPNPAVSSRTSPDASDFARTLQFVELAMQRIK